MVRIGRSKGLLLLFAAMLLVAAPARGQDGASGASMCGAMPALVEPTPAIAASEICASIAALAADSMEGRAAGTPSEERAAAYVARRLGDLGLDVRTQEFSFSAALSRDTHHAPAAGDSPIASTNVIGILEGADPVLRAEAVLLGAHYDHLGWGGPGSLAPGERAIHNGADDNASGVAGLLELAQHFASRPPRRTLVFAAFGAEELGAVGSQHYVRRPLWPLERTVAMINLDMIGRLRGRLTVQGVGSSPQWSAVLDSLARLADAPELVRIPDGIGPSDHSSFYLAEVPVLFFFTGAHEDYHRPTDDVDGIDAAGTARVLQLAATAIAMTADREERIRFLEAPLTQRHAAAFRVGLGIVPDYGFAGRGVRLSGARAGGPADRAGLRVDDVLVELDGRPVDDLYGYMDVLAELAPSHPVEAVVLRGAERLRVVVEPEPR